MVLGCGHNDGLAPVEDLFAGEHRPVRVDLADPPLAWNVLVGEDGVDPGQGQRRPDVDPGDPGTGEGGAAGGAPQHAFRLQVGGIGEIALHLGDAVGPGGRDPHSAPHPGHGGGRRSHPASLPETARRMEPYPVHRHTLPDSASRISSSVGAGLRSSR